jgi:hypothetical protein
MLSGQGIYVEPAPCSCQNGCSVFVCASKHAYAITSLCIEDFSNNMKYFLGINVHHETSCHKHEPGHRVRGQGHLR